MTEPGVSDLEKEKLLAEIGVEPSGVSIPVRAAPPPPPPPPPPPAAPEVAPAEKAPPPPAAPRRAPAWWRYRHVAAGAAMATAGALWTTVALGFGDLLAGLFAALGLGVGSLALWRPIPLPKKS